VVDVVTAFWASAEFRRDLLPLSLEVLKLFASENLEKMEQAESLTDSPSVGIGILTQCSYNALCLELDSCP